MSEAMGAIDLNRGGFDCNRKTIVLGLLFLIPLIGYSVVILRYAVDVPFQDDYDAILYFLNHFVEARTLQEKWMLLFVQHNEHRIVFDRIVALCYYTLFGEINFKSLIIFGNFGWLLTVIVLASHIRKKLGLSLIYLLPIPYILLSFGHWENMFFAMAALQNYWFVLFSVWFLICLSANKSLSCTVVFWAAMFTSGGGIVLYLFGNLYFVVTKRWKSLLLFFALSTLCVAIYFYGYQKPPYHPSIIATILNPLRTIEYFFAYWGNIGPWPLPQLYIAVGMVLSLLSIYLAIKGQGNIFWQLLIYYIALISVVTTLTRSGFGVFQAAASRYTLFPLLALVSIYIFIITSARVGMATRKIILAGTVVCAMLFWWANIFVVEHNHYFMTMKDERIASIVEFDKGKQGGLLYPEQERARQILLTAKKMHIYEY